MGKTARQARYTAAVADDPDTVRAAQRLRNDRLYSEGEFDLGALAGVCAGLVEAGRSGVHPVHRSGAVITPPGPPSSHPPMPPLFQGYLRLGAWVCGSPAHDPDFGAQDDRPGATPSGCSTPSTCG